MTQQHSRFGASTWLGVCGLALVACNTFDDPNGRPENFPIPTTRPPFIAGTAAPPVVAGGFMFSAGRASLPTAGFGLLRPAGSGGIAGVGVRAGAGGRGGNGSRDQDGGADDAGR